MFEIPKDLAVSRRPIQTDPFRASSERSIEFLLRKEVIQPQVPLRLPCYDFIPVTTRSLGLRNKSRMQFGSGRLP